MKRALPAMPNPEDDPSLPTHAKATRCLEVSRRFVMDEARRGNLPCVVYRLARDGRATVVVFDRVDLELFTQKHKKEPQG